MIEKLADPSFTGRAGLGQKLNEVIDVDVCNDLLSRYVQNKEIDTSHNKQKQKCFNCGRSLNGKPNLTSICCVDCCHNHPDYWIWFNRRPCAIVAVLNKEASKEV